MKIKLTALKSIRCISGLLLVVQSLTPGLFALHAVYAQEATPSAVQQQTPTPTPTPEPTVSVAPTVTPTPTPEISPSITPEPTPTVTPTETITPTPSPAEASAKEGTTTEPPHETSPPSPAEVPPGGTKEGTPEPATPTPTITVPKSTEGHITANIIKDVKASSLNLDSSTVQSSGTLSTDKADYAPTDTAVITGTGFLANHSYSLTISSDDAPATSTTVSVTTDANGTFIYAYQLDGTYRPNYKVESKDGASIVATTTFTDCPSNCPQPKPDLTITKTNKVNGLVTLGDSFQWTIVATNIGSADAVFDNGENILVDNLPIGPTYAVASFNTSHVGNSDNITCAIQASDLVCSATDDDVQFTHSPHGSLTVVVNVLPSATGALGNPRADGQCKVDPNGAVQESNEANNTCSDSVTVVPVYTPTTICHATKSDTNPYVEETPNTSGQLMGHVGPGHQNGKDIIPQIPYYLPDGQNWDASGQAIWRNHCVPPQPGVGSIAITKVVDDQSANPSDWSFVVTGPNNFSQTVKSGITIPNLPFGTYTATENTQLLGYHFVGSANSTEDCAITDGTATITISQNGQQASCVFHNTRDTGNLKVKKVVDDRSDLTQWKFSLDGGTAVAADSQGNVDFGQVATGVNHTITEQGLAGYYLDTVTGINCSARQNGNATTATVANGGTTTCQFSNKKIPQYSGPMSCPNNTKKNLLGTYSVSSTAPTGITVPVVTAGNSYVFEATGTYNPTSAPGYAADAGYTTVNSVLSTLYGINGTPPDYAAHALLANLGSGVGVVNWGTYTPTHTYSAYLASAVSNPQFVIGDRFSTWYGTPYDNQAGMNDNQGSLTLHVYECLSNGTITVDKVTTPAGDPQQFAFTLKKGDSPVDTFSLADATTPYSNAALTPGTYSVSEVVPDAWTQTSIACTKNEAPVSPSEIVINGGDSVHCTFNNQKKGSITVTKYNDANGDGNFDRETESALSKWTMNISGNDMQKSDATNTDGQVTFDNLLAGQYILSETKQDGWDLTNISCTNEKREGTDPSNKHTVSVSAGQTTNCFVGNKQQNPLLTITKSNDTGGGNRAPGDSVLFTIQVTATQSAVNMVTVIDLPAAGFTYRTGTWTAVSSIHGPITIPEPVYHSPGTWNLGNMAKDETITLTYRADIDSGELPGLYKDLAWTQGTSLADAKVMGNAGTGIFVGTNVNVVKEQQQGSSINVIHTEQGTVLGAATELPATGANAIFAVLASALFTGGLVMTAVGYVLRRKYA